MKKVLIIGAKGTLGSELVDLFSADKNYEVAAYDIENIDITSKDQVDMLFLKEMPDIVINAAAYNAVDKAEEDDKEYEKAKMTNGEAPKFLAGAAKKHNAVFVQYVSDYVFDGEKGEYAETDRTNPISRYGRSKDLGEKNVKRVGDKYYLIRTSKLFGKPGKSKEAKKSFFETILMLAKEKDSLKVIDSERSCFTYVPDLAKATKRLVEEEYRYGIYHLINEGAVTWYEGVKTLFEIAKIKTSVIPVSSEEFPRPAKRPRSSVLLNTKFPKLRNYKEAIKEWLRMA
ncbi:MAG: dTDP-4-dehydrorhamnose reductase [Patescibacteria group bacterium]|nr:dTDP-4-dehydrorhamnose reductase [Patescibacteria group bacterium]